jgi:hypothetical protein
MALSTVILPSWQVLCLCYPCQTPKREKVFKNVLSLGTQVLLALPAGTHPMFTKPASLDALYVKGQVRPPVKGQNAQVLSSKKLLVVISRAF